MDMDKEYVFESTVQGRDTPVPVEVRGGQAGPTRSSSNDREAQSVVYQAAESTNASGLNESDKELQNPFRRGDSIPRTPPVKS